METLDKILFVDMGVGVLSLYFMSLTIWTPAFDILSAVFLGSIAVGILVGAVMLVLDA